MRRIQATICSILLSGIANLTATYTAYSVEITQSLTIDSTNYSYDGQDLIVNAATIIINGSHKFNSIQLINGAVLTHSQSHSEKLVLTSNTVLVDASSSIDLTGKGNLPTIAVRGASGGSHGGRGGIYGDNGSTNSVFGNPELPTNFGIGGKGDDGETYGGGAIQLITDELTLNGNIIADGQNFDTFFSSQGGGAGGSILLDVVTLRGSGSLQANGGSGYTFYGGGGGGGGRIAIYYKTSNFDFDNNIFVSGGVSKPLFGENGQLGTIFLKDKSIINKAPVVDAGLSLMANEQSNVNLVGTATDIDGTISLYSWSQISGLSVNLTAADTASPNFIAPTVLFENSPSILRFRLTVTDNEGATASSETSVGILAINAPPVVSAGADINTNTLNTVTLSGSAEDSDGKISTFHWEQIAGITVLLNNSQSATASFIAPQVNETETLHFRLSATDNESATQSDEVFVNVSQINTLPIAVIDSPDSVTENSVVFLDGNNSNDPDTNGSISSYSWTQIEGPSVTIVNSKNNIASFTAPTVYQDTLLRFRLDILDNNDGAASTTSNIIVHSLDPDDDNDGMPDLWEIQYFFTLDNDGTKDSDNDGASDLQEYSYATDPTSEQQPAQPVIISPDDSEVTTLQPKFTLANPNQHINFPVSYEFEIYNDITMTNLMESTTTSNLIWSSTMELSDNTRYYWRARAVGTTLYSEWVNSQFFVNTVNDAPEPFNISYPQSDTWISNFTPTLSVTNSLDIDEDVLHYRFEVFLDDKIITASENILSGADGITDWTVDVPLEENTWYQWRAIVSDAHGLSRTSNSEPFIFINTINDAPATPTINTPEQDSEIPNTYTYLFINNSTDPDSEIIHYQFELDTVNTFDSVNKLNSEVIETADITGWAIDNLTDNTWYYWRVKASDGLSESQWTNSQFFVNQYNDAPESAMTLNPGNQSWVGSMQPTLEVYPAYDIDGDVLSYEFNVYTNTNPNSELELIASGYSDTTFWQIDIPLTDSGNYYWQARTVDEHGLASDWSNLSVFFADDDGQNDSPEISLKSIQQSIGNTFKTNKNNVPNNIKHYADHIDIKWQDYDPDSNAHISLYYDDNRYGEDGVLIEQLITEDPDGISDHYRWDISRMVAGVYYVYAVIDDGNSSSSTYSSNAIVVGDGGGSPFLLFNSSEVQNQGKRNRFALLSWQDIDNNNNATINLFYDLNNNGFDGTRITDAIAEDSDGKADKFLWNISELPEDTYYIYATIDDGLNSYSVYANEPISIKHSNTSRK